MNELHKKIAIKEAEDSLHYLEENELNEIKELLNNEQCDFIDTIIYKANDTNNDEEKHMRKCFVASYLKLVKNHPKACLAASQDVLIKIRSEQYDFIDVVNLININLSVFEKMLVREKKKKRIENLSHEGHFYLYTLFVMHISIVITSALNILDFISQIITGVTLNTEQQQDFVIFIGLLFFSSFMIKKYGEAIYIKVDREGGLIDKIKNIMW